MSHSYYRGELSTNEKIKGPFTEAKDDFSEAFDILADQMKPDTPVQVFCRPLEPADVEEIMFQVGGVWVIINREGRVEIGEGAG